jgi:hypothetical protein
MIETIEPTDPKFTDGQQIIVLAGIFQHCIGRVIRESEGRYVVKLDDFPDGVYVKLSSTLLSARIPSRCDSMPHAVPLLVNRLYQLRRPYGPRRLQVVLFLLLNAGLLGALVAVIAFTK